MRILNEAVAHLDMVNPAMADLLPVEYEYVPGTFVVVSKPAGAPDPTMEVLPNYGSTPNTLLRATFAGATSYNLPPGKEVVFKYAVKVADGTPPKTVVNKAAVFSMGEPQPPNCPVDEQVVDVNDLDGDGNVTEVVCQNPPGSGNTLVGVLLALESRKLVKGVFDTEFSDFGHTAPGNTADYRLEITNTSNVSITNLVVVDILPWVGDTGVIDPSSRLSKWQPNLVGEVAIPSGVPLTVFYSQSTNPCRPELVAGGPSGCVNDWSKTLPLNAISGEPDPTLVRAVKLDFCTYTGAVKTACLKLERNETQSVTWPMRAPVEAPVSEECKLTPAGPACQIAWNSFGVTAEGAGLTFLPTEPIKVGIGAYNSGLFGVGDFVWLDVAGLQNDGVQQPEEQGLNGIRVELWAKNGTEPLATTLTANDQNGKPGYYLFDNQPAGDYFVRFYRPDAFTASPANQGADDTKDSDGVLVTGTNYYDTATIALGTGPDRVQTQWDFGLVRITEYADAPWNGTTFKYPTSAALLQAASLNPADAARHIIVSETNPFRLGALRDAEVDGQQSLAANGDDINPVGSDDEDGVTLPSVVTDVAGTGEYGVFMRGVASNVTIAVTAPTTGTAYINAWIDWNADGDWD